MSRLIECVPNFSEGRDPAIIRRITDEISAVEGVALLHVDPGKSTNRTVVTFAGEPEPVVEAAFRAIRLAGELIDMRKHQGEHPRMGATDVCPLVPIAGISLEETAAFAVDLGRRVGDLGIPVYLYEAAQPDPDRRNLSVIRAGEYEGFAKKMEQPAWAPDAGPATFNAKTGATAIGARDFLVAYNVNLNTTSTRRANAIAFDVREAGRPKREGNTLTGKLVRDAAGNPVGIPGTLKAVKAIGWYIDEYRVAQVSMNLTDLRATPIHQAFDEVSRAAQARGIRVTGSELVGLVPLAALLDAGRHYLRKQQRSLGVSEDELIHIAIKSLGLDELGPFDPAERIIEYRLRDTGRKRLVDLSTEQFTNVTASEAVAPGGGSVAALVGALGASLGTMVANLSSHKRGWDERWEGFSQWAESGQRLKADLLRLVDEDTAAFDRVMVAMGMPKGTPEEQGARAEALESANRGAIEVPWKVMKAAADALPLLRAMATDGMPASASDAGVGVLCVQAAVQGAWLNVRTNLASLAAPDQVAGLIAEGRALTARTQAEAAAILAIVEGRIGT